MSKAPPTPRDRLSLFCALADDYDAMAEAFPVETRDFRFGDEPTPPAEHWSRVVRAVALRKFVLAKSDQVHATKVLEALADCAHGEQVADVVANFSERLTDMHTWLEYDEGGNKVLTADELTEDLIYGGLLHGDFDRWQRVRVRAGVTVELSTWQFVTSAETYVRRLRNTIRAAESEGLLDAEGHPAAT